MSPDREQGRRRRAELVDAGVELLAQSGWEGLTHRGVAERAGANPGLVHYYFKGTEGLRRSVAERAAGLAIGDFFQLLDVATSDADLVAAVVDSLERLRADPPAERVIAELVSAAFADAVIAEIVAAEFARGRSRLTQWLREHHRRWPADRIEGTATVLVGAIDGLALQMVLDPGVPLASAAPALARCLGVTTSPATPGWMQGRMRG